MAVRPLQPSGRVIAGGRLLLACLFLIAVWADTSPPARVHVAPHIVLTAFAAWSLAITFLVWNDWWRDARLAAPAHVIDVAVFMIMLFSTEGYTSPYFTFFIFVLLAAAMRWSWRETAITAAAIIAIYFTVGLMFGPTPQFEFQRFIVRTGHLFIISAILIWFGANRWIAWPRLGFADGPAVPVGGDPFIGALQAGMSAIGARRGTLLWREATDAKIGVVSISPEKPGGSVASGGTALPELPGSLLFEQRRNRALMRTDAGQWCFQQASETLSPPLRKFIDERQGLALPFATGTVAGVAVFQDVRALSTDHLDFAPRLARDIAAWLQEGALFAAVEERSMARARVAVAQDLHDNIVQFLAGLGFRLEALKRSPEARGALGASIVELKDMVMAEQRHLRAFIRGLQTGRSVALADVSSDCASLCHLLARQWSIDCTFNFEAGPGSIPMRMQLDIQQLVREAVANAVRHGGAERVAVSLRDGKGELCLTIADDGRGFAPSAMAGEEVSPPASLSARVREARGKLKVSSTAAETSVVIRLPIEAAA